MRIPRSYVDSYSRSLNAITDRARSALVDALASVDMTQDVAEVREQVVAILQAMTGASADMAARLAADFYDGLRAEFGISDEFYALVDGGYDPEATEGAVRAFAQLLADGDSKSFVDRCIERIDADTRRSANECVVRNARRDPMKPKYARVPSGSETCRFCMMLASRGFVYNSPELASHAHPNCDCRVVPSWDKKGVEDYDPDYYYDVYRHPEKHPEVTDAINARRRELRVQRRSESGGEPDKPTT